MISYILPKLWSLQQKYFILQIIPCVDVWLVERADEILQGLDVACHMLNPILKKKKKTLQVKSIKIIQQHSTTKSFVFQNKA